MKNPVLEKKIRRMSSKELIQRLDKPITIEEKEIIEETLKKRDAPGYRDPSFEEESRQIVKEIAIEQTKKEALEKPVKKQSPRVILSEEDSKKISQILETFPRGSTKKEIIITLLGFGFTKQQLGKYRPPIAHWEYIYELANQLEK